MISSKHSFSFQHIQNSKLILSILNENGQNGHNGRKQMESLKMLALKDCERVVVLS